MKEKPAPKRKWTIDDANAVYNWLQKPNMPLPFLDGVVPARLAEVGVLSLDQASRIFAELDEDEAMAFALYVAGFEPYVLGGLGLDTHVERLKVPQQTVAREASQAEEVIATVAEVAVPVAPINEPVKPTRACRDTRRQNLPVYQAPVTRTDNPSYSPDDGPLAWQVDAPCTQTDPEAFFPEKGGSASDAKKVCLGCYVREVCLDYAMEHDERFGVWGGLSERERRKLKRNDT